jgi:hypothetical protein
VYFRGAKIGKLRHDFHFAIVPHMTISTTQRAFRCLLAAAFVPGLYAAPAAAEDAQGTGFGRPDCRIAAVAPAPAGAVDWKGGCKDGYAEGTGELGWRAKDGKRYRLEGTLARGAIRGEAALALPDGSMYSGTFVDGIPDGKGVFLDPDGTMYEGEVHKGERTGAAVGVSDTGDRYEGQWLNGRPEGQGRMKYALGGEYVGAWHSGMRHGHGILTYVGSGRRFEGEFVHNRIAGAAAPQGTGKTYDMVTETANGIYQPRDVALGLTLPPDVGYAALTLEQKRLFNSYFPALEEGDEPPYPIEGPQKFYEMMSRAAGSLRLRGRVTIYANVGADGKVATIALVGLDNPDFRARAAAAAAALKYKPAVCRGQPCAMRFPFRMQLDVER